MEAGRMAVVAAEAVERSGVRLRAERRMAPTGSRTTAARMAEGTGEVVRE